MRNSPYSKTPPARLAIIPDILNEDSAVCAPPKVKNTDLKSQVNNSKESKYMWEMATEVYIIPAREGVYYTYYTTSVLYYVVISSPKEKERSLLLQIETILRCCFCFCIIYQLLLCCFMCSVCACERGYLELLGSKLVPLWKCVLTKPS